MDDDRKNKPGGPGADPAGGDPAPIEEGAEDLQAQINDAARHAIVDTARRLTAAGTQINGTLEQQEKIIDEVARELAKNTMKFKKTAENVGAAMFKTALLKFAELAQELEELAPYIEEELRKPEYNGLTLDYLFEYETPEEEATFKKVWDAARKARQQAKNKPYKPEVSNFPVDRLNFMLPTIFDQPADGQLTFAETLNMNKAGKDDGAYLILSVLFDDEEGSRATVARRIDHTDARIMGAISAAMDAGKDILSLKTIWRALGGKGDPQKSQREKIKDHMNKMLRTAITINNQKEAEAYNYYWTNYNGAVLPWESADEVRNGHIETYYHILRYPPLMEFAKDRGQLTKIPIKVLQSPGSSTERKYQIEDYLLYRIARAKNELAALEEQQGKKYTKERAGKIKEKKKLVILFDTLLTRTGHAGSPPSWQKRNILEPAEKILSYYASEEAGHYIAAVRKEGKTKGDKTPVKFVITLK